MGVTPSTDVVIADTHLDPVFSDVNGDGRMEVLVSADGGQVSAYSWNKTGYDKIWGANLLGNAERLIPVDLDGDAKPGIIVARDDSKSQEPDGRTSRTLTKYEEIQMLDGGTGTRLWSRTIREFRSVTAIDLDADLSPSQPEVIVTTNDGEIQVLEGGTGKTLWSHTIEKFSSIATGDVTGDGQSEVLAASDDGTVHVLMHSPQLGADREIAKVNLSDERPIGGLVAADIDGSQKAAVVAWLRDSRDVYVLRDIAAGSSEPGISYSMGADVQSVTAVDLDKNGIFELFATADDGSGYLLSLTLNQPVLMLNARYPEDPRPGTVEKYSVDVIDPENSLEIVLEVPNPGQAPWLVTERLVPSRYPRIYNQVGAKQSLEWSEQPFEAWDSGRNSRPRFVAYSDGNVVGRLELPEITVEGTRGEYVYGAFAVLGMGVVATSAIAWRQRRRRRAASPEGQARLLQKRIHKAPERLLAEICDVVAHRQDASEILTELHVLCTREGARCATGTAEVVQGYAAPAQP